MPKRERAVTMAMEGRILEEMMPRVNVASKVFTSKSFIILNDNNQQSSKDIFMKEDDEVVEEDEEVEMSSFDSLLLDSNNEPPSTKRPSWWWWWFTKDVLRRTTKETQLDEEDYYVDDEEGTEKAEAKRRNTNRGIKVRVEGGILVEEGSREEPMQERLYPKARAHTYTRFTSSLCVLWRVREAILWWLSLWKGGDGNYEGGCKDPAPNLTLRKPPPSLLERWLLEGCCTPLVGGRRHGKH